MGRVVGEFKRSHELQLHVVWQHEDPAVLTSSNLKPPLPGDEGPSKSLPHPSSAGPPSCVPLTCSSLEGLDVAPLGLERGGRDSKEANNLLGPFFSALATLLGDLSPRQVQPNVRSENHNNVSIYITVQQMFAEHLLCLGHGWYWEYKTRKVGFPCLKSMQLEEKGRGEGERDADIVDCLWIIIVSDIYNRLWENQRASLWFTE